MRAIQNRSGISLAMILLITASSNGGECARALVNAAHMKAEVALDIRKALNRLRESEFRMVVLDESMADGSAPQMDVLLKHLGTAVPVFVNLGLSSKERVVRDVLTALRRVEEEKAFARRSVEWELCSQLKADLAGMLLSAEQALTVAELPGSAAIKLKNICELAERMKVRLSAAAGAHAEKATAH